MKMDSHSVCYFGFVLLCASLMGMASAGDFSKDFRNMWGADHTEISNKGKDLKLTIDQDNGGSGYVSNDRYLFGRFDMKMKLIPGNSAGTITTIYLSSIGDHHDEIDFEFVGNASGNPYLIHTNVYAQGMGNKEQQFHLGFDPSEDFHTYSIIWNPQRIIFMVDHKPIRVFNNMEKQEVPFPTQQPMKIYLTLWNNDDWATNWGKVKPDWSKAPFPVYYRDFKSEACVWTPKVSCADVKAQHSKWWNQVMEAADTKQIKEVQSKHMTYNYCDDEVRYGPGGYLSKQGIPHECTESKLLQKQ